MNPAFKVQVADVGVEGHRRHARRRSRLERLNMALWLIINSPDYSVQK